MSLRIEIDNPRYTRNRESGMQRHMAFVIPSEFVAHSALIAIGGTVEIATGGDDGGRVVIKNPTTIQTRPVGPGGNENENGRIRVKVPNDQRGSIVMVVVL